MKKFWIPFVFILLPVCAIAQHNTEYNRKGDEAMKRRDYSDARLFYSEGVSYCDMYSIGRLTNIWLANEQMRTSMYNLMSRCFTCLQVGAENNDTTAISKLIVYYSKGIGTHKNEELAYVWKKKLRALNTPAEQNPSGTRPRMSFFSGYSYSVLSPVGVTVGGVGKRFGWYGRFKTNASFQDYDMKFKGVEPVPAAGYLYPVKKKANSYAVTAGWIVKCTSWLYTSVGVGYGNRELLYLYSERDDTGMVEARRVWYKKQDDSYSGFALEADFMVRFKSVYLSAGLNTLNFDYVDLNAGIGLFF